MLEKKQLNQRGSALIWSMLVLAMLSIFVATTLTIAFSYHQRSLNSNSFQQAYFSARSTAQAIAVDLINGNEKFLPVTIGDTVSINSISYPADKNMGECSAVLERINNAKIKITGKSTVGKSTSAVTVNIVQKYAEIKAFSGGFLVQNQSDTGNIDGDYFYAGHDPLTIDFKVNGSVIAPFAPVTVTAGGVVNGSIMAQYCSYQGSIRPIGSIIVERKDLTISVPKDTVVVETKSIEALIKTVKPDFIIPDSFLNYPTGYDFKMFSAIDTPPLTLIKDEKGNGPDYTIAAGKDVITYCIAAPQEDIDGNKSVETNLGVLTCTGDATGFGSICIYVPDGITFNFSSLTTDSKDLTIYLILGENSVLSLNAQENLNCFVYGPKSSKIISKDSSSITGEIAVGQVEQSGGGAKLSFTSDSTLNSETTILVPAGWKIAKFEDGNS